MSDGLFDTSIFIDYYRGDAGARELMNKVFSREMTASYSPVTIFELWLGAMRVEEEAFHNAILVVLEEAGFDGAIARKAADLLRPIASNERNRLLGDAFIAATATHRSEPIYTRNIEDFQRFGIALRTYWFENRSESGRKAALLERVESRRPSSR